MVFPIIRRRIRDLKDGVKNLEGQEVARGSGILLAVSSLPSEYGIGTLGDAAFHFVDLLVDLKQKYWQVLPAHLQVLGTAHIRACRHLPEILI